VLFDIALATTLTIATVQDYSDRVPTWWFTLYAVPMIGGLVIRRRWPLLAFALAGAGAALHNLDPSNVVPLDLAVPLTLYTLASLRARRTAVTALVVALVGISLLSLVQVRVSAKNASTTGTTTITKQSTKDPNAPFQVLPAKPQAGVDPPTTVGALIVEAVGRALGLMLVLGLAVAVGDSVRSRRTHLRLLEQRAADLEREQHQRVALATVAERARITRELHDVVAHGLSVIVVQAQGAAAALERHPDRTAEALQNVITTGRESLTEMRRLLDLVRRDPTDGLEPQPGVAALPELIDRVRATGIAVDFTVDGEPVPLPSSVDLSAYRIVQEALTNTLKHGGDRATAAVRLDFQAGELTIDVRDTGVGGAPSGDGTGLRGVAERVGLLGGEWMAGPAPHGGFAVWARLPLAPVGDPA
jgi:signal transduction histidine kinase